MMWLTYKVYKDVLAPPFIAIGVWLVMYIILIIFCDSNEILIKDTSIFIFLTAGFCFFIGFAIVVPRRVNCIYNPEFKTIIKTELQLPLLIGQYVLSVLWIRLYWRDIVGNVSSIWNSIRNSEREVSSFAELLVNVYPIITALFLYAYMQTPSKRNRNSFLLTLPPLLVAMLTSNRTTWFYVLSMLFLIFVYVKRLDNKKIIRVALVAGVAVVVLFSLSSLSKYSNMTNFSSNTDKLAYYFKVYFASPPLAFLQWMKSDYQFMDGKCTFRFFLAILSKIGFNIDVPNTVMDFTYVSGLRTNVYTILHWYSMDFGPIWGCVFQGILGAIFGKLYKNVKKYYNPDRFDVLLIAMFMSIILGEFFCDTFMTHLSAWIQRIIWCYVLCKLLIVKREN